LFLIATAKVTYITAMVPVHLNQHTLTFWPFMKDTKYKANWQKQSSTKF